MIGPLRPLWLVTSIYNYFPLKTYQIKGLTKAGVKRVIAFGNQTKQLQDTTHQKITLVIKLFLCMGTSKKMKEEEKMLKYKRDSKKRNIEKDIQQADSRQTRLKKEKISKKLKQKN